MQKQPQTLLGVTFHIKQHDSIQTSASTHSIIRCSKGRPQRAERAQALVPRPLAKARLERKGFMVQCETCAPPHTCVTRQKKPTVQVLLLKTLHIIKSSEPNISCYKLCHHHSAFFIQDNEVPYSILVKNHPSKHTTETSRVAGERQL